MSVLTIGTVISLKRGSCYSVAYTNELYRAVEKTTTRPIFSFNLFVTTQKTDARILLFRGNSAPNQAVVGFEDGKFHHKVLPCSWIPEYWSPDLG